MKVKVPRLAEAPVSLECTLREAVKLGPDHYALLGNVLYLHVREGLVDPTNLRTNLDAYRPLARLSGNYYASLGPTIKLDRLNYAQWKERQEQIASTSRGGGAGGIRAFVASQIVRPCAAALAARTLPTSSTENPLLRSRGVKPSLGSADQTARTPPGRNAAFAAFRPDEL